MIIEIIDGKHKVYDNLLHLLEDYYEYIDKWGDSDIEFFYHNRSYGYTCKNIVTKEEWSIPMTDYVEYLKNNIQISEIFTGYTFGEALASSDVKNKIQRLIRLKVFL